MVIIAMLTVLLTWGLLYSLLIGIGLLIQNSFRITIDAQDTLISFWVGYAATLALLQIWHLAAPIDTLPLVVVMAAGATGIVRNRQIIRAQLQQTRRYGLLLALPLIAAIFFANRALAAPNLYDTGLYHLQVVQWITTYPVVPGIANLYPAFGLSLSHSLFQGLLDVGFWSGRAFHITNGLLVLAFVLIGFHALFRWIRQRGRVPASAYFRILFIPLALRLSLENTQLADYSSELPVELVIMLLTALGLHFIESTSRSTAYRHFALLRIALLVLAGVTIKLSFAGFGLIYTLVIAAYWVYWHREQHRWLDVRVIALLAIIGAVFLLPWMTRSAIMTGYPVYPFSGFALDIEWRQPAGRVNDYVEEVQRIGRSTYDNDDLNENFRWFRPWLLDALNRRFILIPLLFAAAGLGLMSIMAILHRLRLWQPIPMISLPASYWLLLPPLAGIIIWLAGSPQPRFGMPVLWTFGFLSLVLGMIRLPAWMASRTMAAATALLMIYFGYLLVRVPLHHPVHPGSDAGFNTVPQVELVSYQLTPHLHITTPVEGYQCWQAPLPCLPGVPIPGVHMRNPDSLAAGFIAQPDPPQPSSP